MPPVIPTPADTPKILKALEDDKTIQWCVDTFGWPRGRIAALINGRRGWLIDPDRDTALIFRNDADEAPAVAAPTPQLQPAQDQPIEPKVIAMTPEATNGQPASNLETLLRRGDQSDTAGTRAAAKRARAAVEDLRQRIEAEAAEAQVRQRIAALEEQLAAAQEQLRSVRPKKTTSQSTRPSTVPDGIASKDVRAWANERGITCPATGRIPNTVVDQYLTAHGLAND
jgi:hypothetical protein